MGFYFNKLQRQLQNWKSAKNLLPAEEARIIVMSEPEKDSDGGKKSSHPPPLPPAQGTRKYWGYIARIVFVVVVAICFNRREMIKESFAKLKNWQAGSVGRNSIPPVEPLKLPEPDYYNPPFDPENPPEPIYSKSGVRMITKDELAAHGHSGPLKPIYLAMMGKVFDVDKGAEHYYGPKGGYNFFTGQ